MEYLQFEFPCAGNPAVSRKAVLAGVVSSGNLEVLIEHGNSHGCCRIEVRTSASGYGGIWQAVLSDFASRHDLNSLQISINDFGATPAVVSLRLDQAIEEYAERCHE